MCRVFSFFFFFFVCQRSLADVKQIFVHLLLCSSQRLTNGSMRLLLSSSKLSARLNFRFMRIQFCQNAVVLQKFENEI
uniref:Putative secreted protein n=1 Tax=Ixodes scapularis TaxID=6945 RepID=A0A4D5S1R2_IXOSC